MIKIEEERAYLRQVGGQVRQGVVGREANQTRDAMCTRPPAGSKTGVGAQIASVVYIPLNAVHDKFPPN